MSNTTEQKTPDASSAANGRVGSDVLLAVGDFVKYKPRRGLLRCGCGQYDRAVIASLEPFVLVSEWGDMLWRSTVTLEDFEKCGEATRGELLAVLDRFKRELFPANNVIRPKCQ
jgi:hypothetical protein